MDILSFLLGKHSAGGGGGGGNDVSNYLDINPSNAGSTSFNWWQTKFALPEMANLVINMKTESMGAFQQVFRECKWTYIPKIVGDFSDPNYSINLSNGFQNCSNVKVLDLSGLVGITYRMSSAFNGCTSLEKLDIRGLTFGNGISFSSMLNNVPNTCLIIVKDDTAKTWINTNFSSYTNVKTASEYEGG